MGLIRVDEAGQSAPVAGSASLMREDFDQPYPFSGSLTEIPGGDFLNA
jgi:hypothetical protein